MPDRPDIWKPALISGALFGFLSGVPFVGLLNCLCCSLVLGAGILSSWMMVRASIEAVSYGRAALTGTVAGMVAAPAYTMTIALFTAMRGTSFDDQIAEGIEQARQLALDADAAADMILSIPPVVLMGFVTIVFVFLFAPFGTLGGVIGRALFERRTPTVAPTPPPGTP